MTVEAKFLVGIQDRHPVEEINCLPGPNGGLTWVPPAGGLQVAGERCDEGRLWGCCIHTATPPHLREALNQRHHACLVLWRQPFASCDVIRCKNLQSAVEFGRPLLKQLIRCQTVPSAVKSAVETDPGS